MQADQLKLSISGAGSVRFDQLQAQRLQFDISGAGEGTLSGQANELMLRVSGKGRLQADQLKTQTAKVHISGIGNATLWVTDKLGASISGIGGVDYYGQPKEVQRHVSAWAPFRAKAKSADREAGFVAQCGMDTPQPFADRDIDPRIDQRLTDLEVKASFTEDTVEQLNQVIVRQQQQIDALLRHLGELRGQANGPAGRPERARTLRDELPPHY